MASSVKISDSDRTGFTMNRVDHQLIFHGKSIKYRMPPSLFMIYRLISMAIIESKKTLALVVHWVPNVNPVFQIVNEEGVVKRNIIFTKVPFEFGTGGRSKSGWLTSKTRLIVLPSSYRSKEDFEGAKNMIRSEIENM